MELQFEVESKLCKYCDRTLPMEEFYKFTRKRDGKQLRHSMCRACSAKKERTPNIRYANTKAQCKGSGVEWSISYEDWLKVIDNPCAYCGGELADIGRACDRIDTMVGYTLENVLPCCPVCNEIRGRCFTVDEMKQIGPVIGNIKRQRLARGESKLERRSVAARHRTAGTKKPWHTKAMAAKAGS